MQGGSALFLSATAWCIFQTLPSGNYSQRKPCTCAAPSCSANSWTANWQHTAWLQQNWLCCILDESAPRDLRPVSALTVNVGRSMSFMCRGRKWGWRPDMKRMGLLRGSTVCISLQPGNYVSFLITVIIFFSNLEVFKMPNQSLFYHHLYLSWASASKIFKNDGTGLQWFVEFLIIRVIVWLFAALTSIIIDQCAQVPTKSHVSHFQLILLVSWLNRETSIYPTVSCFQQINSTKSKELK